MVANQEIGEKVEDCCDPTINTIKHKGLLKTCNMNYSGMLKIITVVLLIVSVVIKY